MIAPPLSEGEGLAMAGFFVGAVGLTVYAAVTLVRLVVAVIEAVLA